MRRTKILATIGPASETAGVLREMIQKGLNAVRCNFSHGTAADHKKRVDLVREIAAEEGKVVTILGDLQGPKIRVARFKKGKIDLKNGAEFTLDSKFDPEGGTDKIVGSEYKELSKDLKKGDILLLDDGKIELTVESVKGSVVVTSVLSGGVLSNNKGINKLGGGLTAPALTEKDKKDIKTAAKLGMDYVAVSFVRNAEDVEYARKLLKEAGSNAGIVSKVERAEAVEPKILRDIIKASDAVMVARGDLAVEIGDAQVPAVQKRIIRMCWEENRISITATQMMESMIESPTPTRAEVSDVANAVLDGTDTVMLSAETASGDYPVKTIEAMDRTCQAAEKLPEASESGHKLDDKFHSVDEAIALAAMYVVNHLNVKYILSLTESGSTAMTMSRIRSNILIFALTRNKSTMQRMGLVRGIIPVEFDSTRMPKDYVNRAAVDVLVDRKLVIDKDVVLLTSGDHMGLHGGTNKLKLITVGQVV